MKVMNGSITGRYCPFEVGGELWLQKGGEVFMIAETVELLGLVEKLGSISQAAKAMNISYQKAWTLIDVANRNARLPLIKRKRGGNSGGGAEITTEGRKMIAEFNALQNRFNEFIKNNTVMFGD